MSSRIVYLNRSLRQMRDPLAQPWWQWLERMGIDPRLVPTQTHMVIDDGANTISVRYVDRPIQYADGEMRSSWTVFQLEAPALPVPPGFRVYLDPRPSAQILQELTQ